MDVKITDELHEKLQASRADMTRVELALERHAQKKLVPAFERRREVTKTVPKFWPVALMNNGKFAMCVQHADDQKALLHLEDVWVERHDLEPRAFTIEFHFSENPYFTDKVVKKVYKYVAPPAAKDEKPDEDGITQSMIEFDWERDIESQATKINWKDESKNLVKLHPRVMDDDDVSEPGSFFNFFEIAKDDFELGIDIANDIYPEAIDWFTGTAAGMDIGDSDAEDSDEDDEDDGAEEIDLEKPKAKKQKN